MSSQTTTSAPLRDRDVNIKPEAAPQPGSKEFLIKRERYASINPPPDLAPY